MITVEEAKRIITDVIPKDEVAVCPIEQCLQRVMAQDMKAPFDFPLFSASAMDGYAIRYEDTTQASQEKPAQLKIVSQIFAGDASDVLLHPGEAIQIMTGAMIPSRATAVIPQEEIKHISPNSILISRSVKEGEHIRFKGEEIKQGEVAIRALEIITPAVMGYLASLGIYEVPVFKEPRITILPSGSELIRDTQQLEPGKVFESNSYALGAALKQMGIQATVCAPIPDCKDRLKKEIGQCLETSDFTIISGGVSVGEKDYIRDILAELQVETLFWKVAQKPGKPLFMGKRGNGFIFGLPGNPASALVCFYEYVKPTILRWLGHTIIWPISEQARLRESSSKIPGRTHFLRAQAERENGNLWVTLFPSQESHRMGSFARANCLAVIPQEKQELKKGDAIEIHWIDGRENR